MEHLYIGKTAQVVLDYIKFAKSCLPVIVNKVAWYFPGAIITFALSSCIFVYMYMGK